MQVLDENRISGADSIERNDGEIIRENNMEYLENWNGSGEDGFSEDNE